MATWTNEDGLLVRFDLDRGPSVRVDGTKNAEDHRLVVQLANAAAIGDTDTAAAVADRSFIPAGAIITRAYFVVDTAFTSGGSAVLDIGTKRADGTNIDDDGIDAAIAVAALAANAVIACDGALVPGRAVSHDSYISFTYDTAAFTAGAGRLVVEYTVD